VDNQLNKFEDYRIVEADEVRDSRGLLKVFQGSRVPFPVKRFFWITDVPESEIRGKHGHFETQQLLCGVSGRISIEVFPPYAQSSLSFNLSEGEAFFLPPGHWVSMIFSTPRDILMVAADRDYDPLDVFLEPIK
jgi:hypothetical protein